MPEAITIPEETGIESNPDLIGCSVEVKVLDELHNVSGLKVLGLVIFEIIQFKHLIFFVHNISFRSRVYIILTINGQLSRTPGLI